MTFTYAGFPLTTNAVQWAASASYLGGRLPEVATRTSMLVAVNGAATRTCTVAVGTASACGVMVKSDAVESVVFDDVTTAGQTRWDAVVLRRNWTSNTASYVVVKGTAAANAPQVVPTLNDNPGVLHDQPLALVQITNGNTIPTQVVSLRLPASKVYTAESLAALPTPTTALYGIEVVLADGSRYRCGLDASNNPAWVATSGNIIELTGASALTVATNFSLGSNVSRGLKNGLQTTVTFQLRRTGSVLNADTTDGNFADTLLCTLPSTLCPPDEMPVPAHYYAVSTHTLPAAVTLTPDGRITLIAGVPGQDMPVRTGATEVSVRGSATFTRKVA